MIAGSLLQDQISGINRSHLSAPRIPRAFLPNDRHFLTNAETFAKMTCFRSVTVCWILVEDEELEICNGKWGCPCRHTDITSHDVQIFFIEGGSSHVDGMEFFNGIA